MSATRSEFPYPMRPYDVLPSAPIDVPVPPEVRLVPMFGKPSQETYIVCNYVGHDGVEMDGSYGDAPTSWEELEPSQRPFYTRDDSRTAHPTIERAGLYKIKVIAVEHSISPADDGFALNLPILSRTTDGGFESLAAVRGRQLDADEFGLRTKMIYTVMEQDQLDFQLSAGAAVDPGNQTIIQPSDNLFGLNVGDTFVPYAQWGSITADPFEAKITFSITPVLWFEDSA